MESRKLGVSFGPKNTLRFFWPGRERSAMDRLQFGREILFGHYGLRLEDVLCLQDSPGRKGYDVTFVEWDVLWKVLQGELLKGAVKGMKCQILDGGGLKTVFVHMYDPHVHPQKIVSFLKRYGTVFTGGTNVRKVKDDTGFWTGTWVMKMRLKEDPDGVGGFSHPPAVFAIGADRGYLRYERQPQFCRKCWRSGHTEATCGGEERCRLCMATGHRAEGCAEQRACHACGSLAHVVKDCPERGRAGGGTAGGGAEAGPSEAASAKAALSEAARTRATPSGETGVAGAGKGEVRSGSQAFDGAGTPTPRMRAKKPRTGRETVEVVDTQVGGTVRAGGGQAGVALSYDSRQPSCLFGPPSPASHVETLPDRAEKDDGGKPPD